MRPPSILAPFRWPVWLTVLSLFAINRTYSVLYTSENRSSIRRFRPSFTPSLLPVTLGLVLTTSLYRSGLLTKLLLRNPRYLVERESDLLELPDRVAIHTVPDLWRMLVMVI